jgi:Txe/YoeB family toxin of Txe-Axe toxin-antitoxin module
VDLNESQTKQLQSRINDLIRNHENELNTLVNKYELLHKQVQAYHQGLNAAMQSSLVR